MRLTKEENAQFHQLADQILQDEKYKPLKEYIQHGTVTTYEHSVHVAKTAFLLNRRLHFHAKEEELVRSCLLHDYYLYDWHKKGDHLHGYHHPIIAAKRAKEHFHISEKEEKAIRTHMWPLTLFHVPSGKTAWLLTGSDKLCSLRETLEARLPFLHSHRRAEH